jgi:hypothetical protein
VDRRERMVEMESSRFLFLEENDIKNTLNGIKARFL